ncbi:hypothetical protein IMG5_057330 [Ichthyophthirius multifiliis]|uniref:Calponin-homology (CH) domain-containing protein n=1 Tax=Ichthyophthirius multifiliis TaxID=5932 RepID=G0QND5_ICHMU|nr:hypothetical protein IMG5_057330 [Ichthyophthirius multifiliis]EGR33268.1 hypothetical protein IMG5_057330 [Ichthyophthirius multifiliis]|eukprot:XP_004037254.1 hypothetical protein IMG5_057330 [Ichthyophthirius multifiliis]
MNENISRNDMIQWVNNTLKVNQQQFLKALLLQKQLRITKIEQLGTGAIYCQLFDILFPGKIQLSKLNWKANQEYEFINNFKILQTGFAKLNVPKPLCIEKLVKCKYQDNIEFAQWFKKYFDQHSANINIQEYDSVQKRGKNEVDFSFINITSQSKPKKQSVNIGEQNTSNNSTMQPNQSQFASPTKISNLNKNFEYQLEISEIEKSFYFSKLKDIDFLVDVYSELSQNDTKLHDLIDKIRKILYTTPDKETNIEELVKIQNNQEEI